MTAVRRIRVRPLGRLFATLLSTVVVVTVSPALAGPADAGAAASAAITPTTAAGPGSVALTVESAVGEGSAVAASLAMPLGGAS
ncbi:hypothetical protein ACFCYB_26775 [Streptomyces sp. NPDC056309]|uniref:hypothetical protein n=1 Tax=unclassified Streptomyces TaxID=2593676 RepID=UPI0035E1D0E0